MKASTADETNVAAEDTTGTAAKKDSDIRDMLSTSTNSKQHLGAFVVLDREVDETLTGGFN